MTKPLSRITAPSASEVCKHFALGEEAGPLLREAMTPAQFLDLLTATHHYRDATTFLAHALPKREAVWWGCLCVRATCGSEAPPRVAATLQAAEKWVADPSEDNRRAAMAAAEAAGLGTAAGCAAVAAFWSGGSLGPPNVAVIPPPESLTAKGVAGAVMLAAVETEPEKAPEKYRRFLAHGVEVATGANRWRDVATQDRRAQPDAGADARTATTQATTGKGGNHDAGSARR
jgi:hypothetical protein